MACHCVLEQQPALRPAAALHLPPHTYTHWGNMSAVWIPISLHTACSVFLLVHEISVFLSIESILWFGSTGEALSTFVTLILLFETEKDGLNVNYSKGYFFPLC